jgi:hypothetical protein
VNALPQSNSTFRAPRCKLGEITPAVLRFEDGRSAQAQLEVVSASGGLLQLARPVHPDSRIKLMFLTPSGPVSATAKMLAPLSASQQPFRFVALPTEDQRRIRESVQASADQSNSDEEWIEKYRAAIEQGHQPRRRGLSRVLAALTLAMLCLGSVLYLFTMHIK